MLLQRRPEARAYFHPVCMEGQKVRDYLHLSTNEGWRPEHFFPSDNSGKNLHILQCTNLEKKLSWEGEVPSMLLLSIMQCVQQQTVVDRKLTCTAKAQAGQHYWQRQIAGSVQSARGSAHEKAYALAPEMAEHSGMPLKFTCWR